MDIETAHPETSEERLRTALALLANCMDGFLPIWCKDPAKCWPLVHAHDVLSDQVEQMEGKK